MGGIVACRWLLLILASPCCSLSVGGTVHGDCLQCPFHLWQFDGCSGQAVKIPYSEGKVAATNKTRVGSLVCQLLLLLTLLWLAGMASRRDAEHGSHLARRRRVRAQARFASV